VQIVPFGLIAGRQFDRIANTMKRGKEFRDSGGQPTDPRGAKEITALMFLMVEQTPGAFRLRFVSNDDLINDLRAQGALQSGRRDI
jgi:hypothetical protein